ncbi:MAG: glycoside hydrolase family 70 protein [Streptococcus sp.]|nr:glycoside hydrolase family 70 protein [Streptococcus sp.]
MEKKIHYKLHKVKKNWVAVGVTTLSLLVAPKVLNLETKIVHADDIKQATVDNKQITNQDASEQATATTQKTETDASAVPTTETQTVATENQTNQLDSTVLASAVNANEPTSAEQTSSEEKTPQADASNEKQAVTTADKTVSTKQATVTTDNQKATATDVTTTPVQGQTEKENSSKLVPEPKTLSEGYKAAVTAQEQAVLSRIKTINGKKFYVEEDGTVKKNFALQVGTTTYYFDAETGALADSNTTAFKQGLTSLNTEYSTKNGFYGTSDKDVETVDNYLTADTWYRPKEILKAGKTWTASTEKDFRPLLMAWWPDKQTQVNYLNYMNKQGLGTGTTAVITNGQANLNIAAQTVQKNIEAKIAREGNTTWLRTVISDFVSTQPNWNISTESETTGSNKDHLQGGALLYDNNKETSHANSRYRLLNRTPTNQTGKPKYFEDNSTGGYEFLLANDIDNSHPAVQAEQLNWLHFMMNFGTIVANDPTANFDGVRVDAVDNVNADLLQIASDYFKEYYKVGDSEAKAIAHLSILEAWSDNDPAYNKDTKGAQLPIDNKLRLSLLYSLMRPLSVRSGLEPTINNSLNDRSTDKKNTERMANYVFVRAHDSEVQTVIADIIKQNINPNTDGLTFTMDELKQAFKIYNADMRKADKKYTQFNIPSAYALMLSNKDSITRVYYGDLYTDDGQYMAEKSPYYDALDALMRARIKYVSGGQDMKVTYMGVPRESDKWSYNGILTSVRYGTGANEATDVGTAQTRTEGMAVITSNNPDLKLNKWDTLKVNMGAAHKLQKYRPLLLTTKDGIARYLTDEEVPKELLKETDADGNLTFTMDDIAGYSNVQVSGYLAVWVPVGAKADQDVRVAASTAKNKDGQVYNSSTALDSQLIYEGFSNFQDFVEKEEQYTNKVIAKNANLFKQWGVTSFELPPQYVSSADGSFLDSIIQNGYAFEDRYDMALSKNNKYGSLNDLLNVLRALHAEGIQAIADWVPDQIYNLPGQEVVTATRVNNYGVYREGSEIKNKLYVAKTKTDGTDYQGKYGGAFLDELKAKYPAIFERVQISNGQKITTNEKITKWSAKYFNGTNILGRGAYYVLKDWSSNHYLTNKQNETFLPKQLINQKSSTGFISDSKGIKYYSTSGYQAKDSFIQDEKGNWYYFDNNGYLVTGAREIDGKKYYFLVNGIELRDAIREDRKGNQYYYNKIGQQVLNQYYSEDGSKWRYFDAQGVMARDLVTIDGKVKFFDQNGYQIKGKVAKAKDGKLRYFDANSGELVFNRFAPDGDNWYYFGADGIAVTGIQKIANQTLYFDNNGVQVKGKIVTLADKSIRYFDADSGEMAVNKFIGLANNVWYYFNQLGKAVTGLQTINNQTLYFNQDGTQVKGKIVKSSDGKRYYFDADSGELVFNRFVEVSPNVWYYFGSDGRAYTGSHKVNNQQLYFDNNGVQAKGKLVSESGRTRYYDANSGELATNRFVSVTPTERYYFNQNGVAVTGAQHIGGKYFYFDKDGKQVKGKAVTIKGIKYYYDANSGELTRNRWVRLENGTWMFFDRYGRGQYYGWY